MTDEPDPWYFVEHVDQRWPHPIPPGAPPRPVTKNTSTAAHVNAWDTLVNTCTALGADDPTGETQTTVHTLVAIMQARRAGMPAELITPVHPHFPAEWILARTGMWGSQHAHHRLDDPLTTTGWAHAFALATHSFDLADDDEDLTLETVTTLIDYWTATLTPLLDPDRQWLIPWYAIAGLEMEEAENVLTFAPWFTPCQTLLAYEHASTDLADPDNPVTVTVRQLTDDDLKPWHGLKDVTNVVRAAITVNTISANTAGVPPPAVTCSQSTVRSWSRALRLFDMQNTHDVETPDMEERAQIVDQVAAWLALAGREAGLFASTFYKLTDHKLGDPTTRPTREETQHRRKMIRY